MNDDCVFCRIVKGGLKADVVAEDEHTLSFLDSRPVFPGHVLVIPRQHIETLGDLDDAHMGPFFSQVRRAAQAVEAALDAEGTFVAQNNKVSQTVPHLHVHIIPRRKGDGMKGFFWPRRDYRDDSHRAEIVERLRGAFRKS